MTPSNVLFYPQTQRKILKNWNVCYLNSDNSESVTRIKVGDISFCKSLMCDFTLFMLLYAQFSHNSVPMVWFRYKKLLVMVQKRSCFGRHTHSRKTSWGLLKKCRNHHHPLHVPTWTSEAICQYFTNKCERICGLQKHIANIVSWRLD